MPISTFRSGAKVAWKRLTIVRGGVAKRAKRLSIVCSGARATVASFTSDLSVTANNVSGRINDRKPATVTSQPSSASPTGGLSPYSYSWAVTSGDVSALSPTMAATRFSAVVAPSETKTATARVTVTDAFGGAAFADVSIALTNEGSL